MNEYEVTMLDIAKDLLKYGYTFKYFYENYEITQKVGKEKSKEIWNKAIDIMCRDF